jgi:signal transduction histidine kinase
MRILDLGGVTSVLHRPPPPLLTVARLRRNPPFCDEGGFLSRPGPVNWGMVLPQHRDGVHSARTETVILTVALWGTFLAIVSVLTFLGTAKSIDYVCGVSDCLVGLIISPIIYAVVVRFEHRPMRQRAAAIAATVVVAASTVWLLNASAQYWIEHANAFRPIPMKALLMFRYNWLLYGTVIALQTAAFVLLRSNQTVRVRDRQLAEARLAAHQAQLAALRFQLNPHFLFNTLNAISTLVVEAGATEAEAMIGKLSDFLRASLSADPGDFIALEDEFETVQAYMDIESVRFGERLDVHYACEPGLSGALVPSLILQPLVENAVKYAVAPSKQVVSVRIEARAEGDQLVLVVADDGRAGPAGVKPSGTGVGLRYVRGRLEALYGPQGSLDAGPGEDGFTAVLRMPLRRAEKPGPDRSAAETSPAEAFRAA